MTNGRLSSRTTLFILVAAQVVFLLVLVGVLAYIGKVGNDANLTNRRLGQVNRAAIERDCRDKEELKKVMLAIMAAVIDFNAASPDPELRKRAVTYRMLVSGLRPITCDRKE